MSKPLLALCASALLGVVLHAVSAEQASVAEVRLEAWLKAVEDHQPGQADEAARTVASWDNSELFGAITTIQRKTPPNVVLARGAMLHLDVAMRFRTAATGPLFPSRMADKYFAIIATDGQRRGQAASPTHLQFGRALLEEMKSPKTKKKRGHDKR